MQKYKSNYINSIDKSTIADIQSCLRINDIEEIKDGNHLLYFNMIGLYSFNDWSLKKTINFFIEYITNLNIKIDYVTIHPDKKEWMKYYEPYGLKINFDEDCIWSDGKIGGYCTEFYSNGLEIGNIVNTLGKHIDVGFGLERLEMILTNEKTSEIKVLKETIIKLIDSGFKPSNKQHGYILRKLIRRLYRLGEIIENQLFLDEVNRIEKLKDRYKKLLPKNIDKSIEWWWDTHGIIID